MSGTSALSSSNALTWSRIPGANDDDNLLRVFIAALNSENARVSKEKADALQTCANIQKEHAATTAKYKDAHARYTNVNQLRIDLEGSLARRIMEKDEAVAKIESLTKDNAQLLQIHADLAQENAALKEDNVCLVGKIQPFEQRVMALQTENASLQEEKRLFDSEREQLVGVKAERDELRRQVEARNRIQQMDNDRKRGRSRTRSRSPQRSGPTYRADCWRAGRYEGLDERYREKDMYRPQYDGPQASPYREEPTPAAPREDSRIPTPRETPVTTSTTHDNPPLALPNLVWTKDARDDTNLPKIPTGPRAGVLFSMSQAKNKFLPNSSKRAKKSNGNKGGGGRNTGRK